MYNQEAVVVTGACGFVGSVLCCRLTELGYSVIAIDNNARGLNKNNLLKLPNLSYYEHDCSEGIKDILGSVFVNNLFHLAAATGDLTRPDSELREINVGLTQLMVDNLMDTYPYANFFFPTTSLALGVPDSGYVKSKEEAISWFKSSDCPLDIEQIHLFRFFNNAGSYRGFGEFRQKEVHMFPRLFRALMLQESFKINGTNYNTVDGTPARDYIHVLDTVDFMIYRMHNSMVFADRLDTDVDALCEIGRGDPKTVLQTLEILSEVKDRLNIPDVENKIQQLYKNVVHGEDRAYDCGSLQARKNSLIHQWRPLRSFEDILVDSLNGYYQFSLENPNFIEGIVPQNV